MLKDVYLYKILRVPSGKRGGIYKNVLAETLGSFLLNQLRTLMDFDVNLNGEVLLSNAVGTMGNMARNALLGSQFSQYLVASTIDFQCGGFYKALDLAFAQIRAARRDWMIVGGIESTSLQPLRYYHYNDPRKTSESPLVTADFAPFPHLSLADSAQLLAKDYKISKTEMQEWFIGSHFKSNKTFAAGHFKSNVIPYKGGAYMDEMIRSDLNISLLKKLESTTVIDRTTTADFHDGAGIVLLGDHEFGQRNDLKPLAKVLDISIVGLNPSKSPYGALLAAELSSKNNSKIDVDLYEICESYAVKPLAFASKFNVDLAKMNVLGGNLAMGHPYAASGVINILNLQKGLELKNQRYGLVSAGVAGGLGAAILIENLVE